MLAARRLLTVLRETLLRHDYGCPSPKLNAASYVAKSFSTADAAVHLILVGRAKRARSLDRICGQYR